MSIIFGACTDHGGAADIDILRCNSRGYIRIGRNLLEWVEVYNDQFNRCDFKFVQFVQIWLMAGPGQYSSVNRRVEGFYPAIQTLLETGDFTYILYRDSTLPDLTCSTPGTDNLHIVLMQKLCQFNNSCFIGDREKSPFNFEWGIGEGIQWFSRQNKNVYELVSWDIIFGKRRCSCLRTRAASVSGVSWGKTGTSTLAMMSPLSYSLFTKCTVQPEVCSPALSTARCTLIP